MICFEIKTDQEVKEKRYVGPTLKKYNKNKNKNHKGGREKQTEHLVFIALLFYFSSLASLFDSRSFDRRISSG